MFKDNEIMTRLGSMKQWMIDIDAKMDELKQVVAPLKEQLEYLAAAEEARATHSKKPVRKGKVEEAVTNEAI